MPFPITPVRGCFRPTRRTRADRPPFDVRVLVNCLPPNPTSIPQNVPACPPFAAPARFIRLRQVAPPVCPAPPRSPESPLAEDGSCAWPGASKRGFGNACRGKSRTGPNGDARCKPECRSSPASRQRIRQRNVPLSPSRRKLPNARLAFRRDGGTLRGMARPNDGSWRGRGSARSARSAAPVDAGVGDRPSDDDKPTLPPQSPGQQVWFGHVPGRFRRCHCPNDCSVSRAHASPARKSASVNVPRSRNAITETRFLAPEAERS